MPFATFGSIGVRVHLGGVAAQATGSRTVGLEVPSPLLKQTGFSF